MDSYIHKSHSRWFSYPCILGPPCIYYNYLSYTCPVTHSQVRIKVLSITDLGLSVIFASKSPPPRACVFLLAFFPGTSTLHRRTSWALSPSHCLNCKTITALPRSLPALRRCYSPHHMKRFWHPWPSHNFFIVVMHNSKTKSVFYVSDSSCSTKHCTGKTRGSVLSPRAQGVGAYCLQWYHKVCCKAHATWAVSSHCLRCSTTSPSPPTRGGKVMQMRS